MSSIAAALRQSFAGGKTGVSHWCYKKDNCKKHRPLHLIRKPSIAFAAAAVSEEFVVDLRTCSTLHKIPRPTRLVWIPATSTLSSTGCIRLKPRNNHA
jgi:hypothetical protein